MRCAAIDVGSNTIRMLIGDVDGPVISRLYSDRAITRLGAGIRESGILKEENMRRSLTVMKGFAHTIATYGVSRVRAVGTSALRSATNNEQFIDAVFREAGIPIRIISGLREAELTAKGVLLGFGRAVRPFFIIDIGGGSTEWISLKPDRSEVPVYGSLSAGVIDLLEKFIKTDPPSPDDLNYLNSEIDSLLLQTFSAELPEQQPIRAVLVGTGGTVTTLASIDLGLRTYEQERIHMHKISLERLREIRDILIPLPLVGRQDMEGLESGRADLIIPGILLTIKLMEFFGFQEISVSDYGLLEGVLKEANE